jgi:signal transduction histidine kinase
MFDVPTSLVTVLAVDRQHFRGACGMDLPDTPRDIAFCNYTVRSSDVFVVEDAATDPRFAKNPLVTGETKVRFYAGAPIELGKDVAIGSLCVLDRQPRTFSEDDRRRLQLLAGTVRDIIELRAGSLAAEERGETLERQRSLLKATVDNVQQGIAVFNQDLGLVLWNERFFDLFGYPKHLATEGVNARELMAIAAARGELGPGDPDDIVEGLIQSIRTTRSKYVDVARTNGSQLGVMRSTMPDGRFILVASDMTEHWQLLRMKDEFISTVSHELRTPLTSIIASLSLIERGLAGALSDRGAQLVGVALQNGKRLNGLINEILDVERLGSGITFELEPVELGEATTHAVEQNRPYAESLAVTISQHLPDEPLVVNGDRGRIQQALSNLISNAAKFSEQGQEVDVTLCRMADRARVMVEDRGTGIPPGFEPRLFQRFAQVDNAERRGRPGSGLGLAITKHIIERHGGTIGYDTEVGRGTTFFFDLPLVVEAEKAG